MDENTYVLGLGKTQLGVGKDIKTETYYLIIEELLVPEKIGVDLKNKFIPSTNKTRIYVKNLEGLAVLEDMIKSIKAKIKNQDKDS